MSSPILTDGNAALRTTGEGGNDLFVDPNTDPELYMALRESLQDALNHPRAGEPSAAAPAGTEAPAGSMGPTPTREEIEAMGGVDDELRQALLLSLQDFEGCPTDVEMKEETSEMNASASIVQNGGAAATNDASNTADKDESSMTSDQEKEKEKTKRNE